MITWGQLIWIFFPIPLFSLVLLCVPWKPQRIQHIATRIVTRIFFTNISIGPFHVQLLWLFFVLSIAVFVNSIQMLSKGGECTGEYCKLHGTFRNGETIWYGKALKFRAERNFWLALFNAFLWLLVWTVHKMKRQILELRGRVEDLEKEEATTRHRHNGAGAGTTASGGSSSTTNERSEEEQPPQEPKKSEDKKKD